MIAQTTQDKTFMGICNYHPQSDLPKQKKEIFYVQSWKSQKYKNEWVRGGWIFLCKKCCEKFKEEPNRISKTIIKKKVEVQK